MFTLPLGAVLEMKELQKHETLLQSGALRKFHSRMGKAMFISHQWLTAEHPDPGGQQFQVLQQALRNLISGQSVVSLPPAIELALGRSKCPKAMDFQEQLYLWYDYFSCPQGEGWAATGSRQLAIASIPTYVQRCFFFVILCPSVSHEDGKTLGHSTWAGRGWCRLELMARELQREDGYIITVREASYPTLAWNTNGVGKAPTKGEFSFEEDREKVGAVLLQMLWNKLHRLLEKKSLPNFRFLLNIHQKHLEGMNVHPIEGLIPGFSTELDPSSDEEGFLIARFLHDNLFSSMSQRDGAGWSPICYAAIKGDTFLVKALLGKRANPNERLTKQTHDLSKKIPVLSLAVAYKNNDVVQVLLGARALVNATCGYGCTPLHWAAISDNSGAVRILKEAAADPKVKKLLATSPVKVACAHGCRETFQELLAHYPNHSLQYCLHFSLLFFGDIDTVSCLIEASADINEQLYISTSRPMWWTLLKMLSIRHTISPSALTYVAYHHSGATPLMFSILTGKYEATTLLLRAGARLDIRNGHGKTALDLAAKVGAPVSLSKFEDDGESSDDTISI